MSDGINKPTGAVEKPVRENNSHLKSPMWRLIRPTFILVIICTIVTSLLSLTYGITAPIIEKNQAASEKKAAQEVLGSKKGVALKTQVKSYGGKMEMMVGIDNDGKITGIKVLSHQDTPGLGTQAMTSDYLAQYVGISELVANHIDEDSAVDAVTGATISSNAIYQGAKQALEDYDHTGGDQK